MIFAVREEHAVLLDDVHAAATSTGFSRDQGQAAVRNVARWMALDRWAGRTAGARRKSEYYRARVGVTQRLPGLRPLTLTLSPSGGGGISSLAPLAGELGRGGTSHFTTPGPDGSL